MQFKKEEIERFNRLETPFYYYDLSLLRANLTALKKESDRYGYHVHYAMKANSNPQIMEAIIDFDFGADCVSGNEIEKALKTGVPPHKIVFAGVGKTDREIEFALQQDIFCFNCESIAELEVINLAAEKAGKKAQIALRINPNVNAKTHKYITTGLEENKFGISIDKIEKVVNALKNLDHLELIGLHFHIGSQILDLSVFKGLCVRVNQLQKVFLNHHIAVKHINVGGGLGVNYENPSAEKIPDYKAFFKIFHDFLELRPNQELHFELGRALVAQCGSLITRVLFVKEGVQKDFVIVDAGMTELLRPALYQSVHKIENLTSKHPDRIKAYDIVGPVCESSDCFAKDCDLSETQRGDIIAIRSTGAYGEVMASRYNLRDLAKSYFSS